MSLLGRGRCGSSCAREGVSSGSWRDGWKADGEMGFSRVDKVDTNEVVLY